MSKQYCLSLFLLILFLPAQVNAEKNSVVPRTILAFYDSELEGDLSITEIHQAAEMPLNHLGLLVRYHDIHKPLPTLEDMKGVRGILLWPYWDDMPKPNTFLRWMIEQMKTGQRVVLMGSHAFETARSKEEPVADESLINQFWKTFGISGSTDWIGVTYDIKLVATDNQMTSFERAMTGELPAFSVKRVTDKSFTSHLKAYRSSERSVIADLVLTGPKGGYIAPDYSLIYQKNGTKRYWFINPFSFFKEAFATDEVPKADTTTLSGRRIYYSHIDGDGWRSISLVPGYKEKKKTVTEVLLREIFEEYPDLPVTVAPVAADIDSAWFGTKEYQNLARKIFSLPHVDAGSHTFSHPLQWGFFEDYVPEYEEKYLDLYPTVSKRPELGSLIGYRAAIDEDRLDSNSELKEAAEKKSDDDKKLKRDTYTLNDYFEIPRAYNTGSFDINKEVQGSIDVIKKYLPEGKSVELIQWSGDTLPFRDVLTNTRRTGLRNLNGGDTRLDREYDSYSWVSPIGRAVDDQRQIYASSSNENTYTNLWKSRFYGYAYLVQTLKRTETPWRIKPINVYYHNYSGERLSSLNALHEIFSYVRSQSITPITASHFAAIGDGFYTTSFKRLGNQRWKIENRDGIQTIRFDNASFKAVDFSRSEGVIGQSHLHGSLYVQLDSAHEAPIVALKKIEITHNEPVAIQPYLISARWIVSDVTFSKDGFDFTVQGFGDGNMNWYVPESGNYRIHIEKSDGTKRVFETAVEDEQWMNIELIDAPIEPYRVKVEAIQVDNEGA